MANAKLKLYVWTSDPSGGWYWDVAVAGSRERPRPEPQEDRGIVRWGIGTTWSETVAKGLAALDELQAHCTVRP